MATLEREGFTTPEPLVGEPHASGSRRAPATRQVASQIQHEVLSDPPPPGLTPPPDLPPPDLRPRARKARGVATPCEMEEGRKRTRVPRTSLEFGSPGGNGGLRPSRLSVGAPSTADQPQRTASPPQPPPPGSPPLEGQPPAPPKPHDALQHSSFLFFS